MICAPLDELQRRTSAKWVHHPPDVLPAWVAESDFRLAPPVAAALRRAIDDGDTGYTHPAAVGPAFAAFAADRLGLAVDPETVLVVPDVMVGVAELVRAVTAPGDAVVINPPVYPPFASRIGDVGRAVAEVPLARRTDGGYDLDLDALERAFAAGARAYLLCSPHNPTGSVWSRDDLAAVRDLAAAHAVTVIADEIHAPLVLPGATFTPYLAVDPAGAALTSASKAFNLAGLKSAVLVPGAGLRLRALDEDIVRWGGGHLGAIAAVAAFREGGPWLDEALAVIAGNRRLLSDLVARHLPGATVAPMAATYLAWIDCRALGLGDDPAAAFLERGRVALSPGPSFGTGGAGFARLNIGTSPELVEEAVRRMAAAVG